MLRFAQSSLASGPREVSWLARPSSLAPLIGPVLSGLRVFRVTISRQQHCRWTMTTSCPRASQLMRVCSLWNAGRGRGGPQHAEHATWRRGENTSLSAQQARWFGWRGEGSWRAFPGGRVRGRPTRLLSPVPTRTGSTRRLKAPGTRLGSPREFAVVHGLATDSPAFPAKRSAERRGAGTLGRRGVIPKVAPPARYLRLHRTRRLSS